MWFLCFTLYLALIPLTAVAIIKYRIDPIAGDLWKKRNRGVLMGTSFCWPVLWCVLLVGGIGRLSTTGFGALLSIYDREEE